MYSRLICILLLVSFPGCFYSQATGEWILHDHPESEVKDIWATNDSVYLLIQSIHDIRDTLKYDYQVHLFKISESTPGESNLCLDELHKWNYANRRMSLSLFRIPYNWILVLSTLSTPDDSVFFQVLDMNFKTTFEAKRATHESLISFKGCVYQFEKFVGIGSIVIPPDSLVSIQYDVDQQGLTSIDVKRIGSHPGINFVSSLERDENHRRFLIFELNGIAHLDDTLGVLNRYNGNTINTATHGTIKTHNERYYSFGVTRSLGNPIFRDLIFQGYDTNMDIVFSDTFGRAGKEDYPFINQCLDVVNGEFYVGGILGSTTEAVSVDSFRFFLAKYDEGLNRKWYKEFGHTHRELIKGLLVLPDERCIIYGTQISNDGIRYPYLLILDENGEITSTEIIPDPDIHLVDIFHPAESGKLILDAKVSLESLQLFSIDGKAVLKLDRIMPGRQTYDVTGLAPGMYVFVATDGKQRQSGKWLKTK